MYYILLQLYCRSNSVDYIYLFLSIKYWYSYNFYYNFYDKDCVTFIVIVIIDPNYKLKERPFI